jgi:hypothetical protein
MGYDKEMLKQWRDMDNFYDWVEKKYSPSDDDYEKHYGEYLGIVRERINYCKNLLKTHDDKMIYFTLACLYENEDIDTYIAIRYKRPQRYYLIKAIRKDRTFVEAYMELSRAYEFHAMLGSDESHTPRIEIHEGSFEKDESINEIDHSKPLDSKQKKQIQVINLAIKYAKKATVLAPDKGEYKQWLKYCYKMRELHYLPFDATREIDMREFADIF